MDWYEKDTVTAEDLLGMQTAVADNEAAQDKAWRDYQDAIKQVPILEQIYESRKWDAECAREELKQMEEKIRGQR